jgi:cell division cycle 20-like protein 1 (cofactor of APC complex)
VWDVARQACVRSFDGHSGRVGCVAWQSHGFASGSRDKSVLMRDMRAEQSVVATYRGHKQEVCGLKFSPDGRQLASGGNDNKLHIWSVQQHTSSGSHSHHRPQHTFHEHLAAVKAIAWSPYQRHLLASGGGTADRHIRFFNTASFTTTAAYDTGSQVCNLTYSRTSSELLSTHGYSLNQIIVWRLPSMQPVATLTGHQMRVLYLSLSPDGATAVTGAGDETVRFWNVFPSMKEREKEARGEASASGGLGGARDSEGSGSSGQVVSLLPTSGQMR